MGATVRSREFDADQPSQTEQLANWINRVRSKKILCRRNRRRNLRVEAVLTSVLSKAEHELRNKQMTRIMKWKQMKQRLLEDICYKDGGYNDDGEYRTDFQNGDDYQDDSDEVNSYNALYAHQDQYNVWKGPLCPELSSLDSFMSQLSEIKAPLQR